MTLSKAVILYPDKTAVVDGDKSFTYSEIGERVQALARFFKTQNVQPKDRISILELNSHVFLEAYYAAAGIGAILTPLNYRLSSRELEFILKDAGAKWLIANVDFVEQVMETVSGDTDLEGVIWIGEPPSTAIDCLVHRYEDVIQKNTGSFDPEPVSENDVAHLYYTSGTTGKPKGVMLTHKNVCLHALGTIAELQLDNTDVWGHIAPMFHLADAWATFAITWVGGRHIMVGRFEPEPVMSTIQNEEITLSNMIPTMLNLMMKHPSVSDYDFSSFRVVLSGGAPIAPELVRSIIETFQCDYIQTYGMTETSPYLTFSLLKDHLKKLPESEQFWYKSKTGRPFIAVDLKVVDDNGRAVKDDDQQVGEILVRGDTITPGYWNRPEETQNAFHEGWLKTGDLAVLDKEGYVNIVDRKKDMIISGGENIYSIEVENVLYMNTKVLEAAVFGVAHEKWGEAVTAAVVLKEGESATEDEIIDFCKQHQASYKAPKSVVFLNEIPKTGSGKITKKALREIYDT
jgi:acyl-CoA synthetase (AMP-forming)/AMP-acid ligase II